MRALEVRIVGGGDLGRIGEDLRRYVAEYVRRGFQHSLLSLAGYIRRNKLSKPKIEEMRAKLSRAQSQRRREFLSRRLSEVMAKYNTEGQMLAVRTGRLRSSIYAKVEGEGLNLTGRVGTNVWYGRVHEYGAEIRPRRARVLHFRLPTGEEVFTRRVVIPARPWLRPSFETWKPKIVYAIERAIQRALYELARR